MERFRNVPPRPARHARSRRSRGPQEVVVKASLEKQAPTPPPLPPVLTGRVSSLLPY